MTRPRNRNLRIERLVVIDVETSGINPFRNDVLAVALVPLDSRVPSKVVYVRPDADIEWGTEFARAAFRKYEREWQQESVGPREACEEIESYLRGVFGGEKVTPIGHNVGFDMAFLRKLAFLGGRDEIAGLSHRAIDTHTLLYLLAKRGEISQDEVTSTSAFEAFSVAIPEAKRHTALGDAEGTRDLFVAVIKSIEAASSEHQTAEDENSVALPVVADNG